MDLVLVAAGRKEEMDILGEIDAYGYDTIANCKQATGRAPVPTRWVDLNKGDKAKPFVRCRWVVQETKNHTTLDVTDPALTFSAAPPYEALRLVLSIWMTPKGQYEMTYHALVLDITRAHPHAIMKRDLWVRLPDEDPRSREPGICAKLKRNQYGTRDAGQNFELSVHETMEAMGFVAGLWSVCVFYLEARDIRAYVYGDNFVITGAPTELDWFYAELAD